MASSADQRQLAVALRAQGHTWVQIAEALRARWPTLNALASMRLAHGWTQDDAADAWNDLFDPPPFKTRKDIGIWEVRRPGFSTLEKLARLYECALADLVADISDHSQLDEATHPRVPDERSAPDDQLERLEILDEEAGVNRRELVKLVGGATVTAPFWDGRVRIDTKVLEGHQALEQAIAGLYRSADPTAALPLTRTYADGLLDLLDQSTGGGSHSAIGAVAAGVHAQVGLWACHMNRPRLAHRYLATSCEIAAATEDGHLHARTLGALSYFYSSAPRGGVGGRPDVAIDLLTQALDLAKNADDFTQGWLATWRADQNAALSRLPAAQADAETASNRLTTTMRDARAGPAGFFAYATYGYGMTNHLDSVHAVVAALDGKEQEAERTFDHALRTSPNMRRRVAIYAHAAFTHVAAGELEAACAALEHAVTLADQEGYGMGIERALGVRAQFDPAWSSTAPVRDLDEQLRLTTRGT